MSPNPPFVDTEVSYSAVAFHLIRDALATRRQLGHTFPKMLMGFSRRVWRTGLRQTIQHLFAQQRPGIHEGDYQRWIKKYDLAMPPAVPPLDPQEFQLSILLPALECDPARLSETIESVRRQSHPLWELCIVVSTEGKRAWLNKNIGKHLVDDPRIKVSVLGDDPMRTSGWNQAISASSGNLTGFLQAGDLLHRDAVACVYEKFCAQPETRLCYSDEDQIDLGSKRSLPVFKGGWDPDLLFSQHYVGNFLVLSAETIQGAGSLRASCKDQQLYDLLLRCAENLAAHEVQHIPQILYHARLDGDATPEGAPPADESSMQVVKNHLDRTHSKASVQKGVIPGTHHLVYPIPSPAPLVSILIPTRDNEPFLRKCIESLLEQTDYPAIEVLVVENGSTDSATLDYYDQLESEDHVRVLTYNEEFNYSAINNFAVDKARGEFVCLLNDDIEIIDPHWLNEMVQHACRPSVGAVGAKLLYPDGLIQHGGVILGVTGVAAHAHKFLPGTSSGYSNRLVTTQSLSAVTGACLLTRRSTYLRLGGLNQEELAFDYSDIDYCLRLGQEDLRILWTPYAKLIHHESVSRKRSQSKKASARHHQEVRYMLDHWGEKIAADPAYNPNLTFEREDFSLSWPPRTEHSQE